MQLCARWGAIFVGIALCACSSDEARYAPALATEAASSQSQLVYAFVPTDTPPSIFAYRAESRGQAKPAITLSGSKTQLKAGNGIAVDSSGTIYALVGPPVQLLAYAPNATGNVAPTRVVKLPSYLVAGNTGGPALDGLGNFWVAQNVTGGKLFRFSLSAKGIAKPDLTISPVLATSGGLIAGNPENVAVSPAGRVYTICTQFYKPFGVTGYALNGNHPAKVIQAFYDTSFSPTSIAIAKSGTIYLSGSHGGNSDIWEFPASTSGLSSRKPVIVGNDVKSVYGIGLDTSNELYVAVPGGVDVFAPSARGNAKPVRTIRDAAHLQFTSTDFGTLLGVF